MSSIEVCIIDEADTLCMQNWEHVLTVIGALNRTPANARDTDFSRVRDLYLTGQAALYRQTVVLRFVCQSENEEVNHHH